MYDGANLEQLQVSCQITSQKGNVNTWVLGYML